MSMWAHTAEEEALRSDLRSLDHALASLRLNSSIFHPDVRARQAQWQRSASYTAASATQLGLQLAPKSGGANVNQSHLSSSLDSDQPLPAQHLAISTPAWKRLPIHLQSPQHNTGRYPHLIPFHTTLHCINARLPSGHLTRHGPRSISPPPPTLATVRGVGVTSASPSTTSRSPSTRDSVQFSDYGRGPHNRSDTANVPRRSRSAQPPNHSHTSGNTSSTSEALRAFDIRTRQPPYTSPTRRTEPESPTHPGMQSPRDSLSQLQVIREQQLALHARLVELLASSNTTSERTITTVTDGSLHSNAGTTPTEQRSSADAHAKPTTTAPKRVQPRIVAKRSQGRNTRSPPPPRAAAAANGRAHGSAASPQHIVPHITLKITSGGQVEDQVMDAAATAQLVHRPDSDRYDDVHQ